MDTSSKVGPGQLQLLPVLCASSVPVYTNNGNICFRRFKAVILSGPNLAIVVPCRVRSALKEPTKLFSKPPPSTLNNFHPQVGSTAPVCHQRRLGCPGSQYLWLEAQKLRVEGKTIGSERMDTTWTVAVHEDPQRTRQLSSHDFTRVERCRTLVHLNISPFVDIFSLTTKNHASRRSVPQPLAAGSIEGVCPQPSRALAPRNSGAGEQDAAVSLVPPLNNQPWHFAGRQRYQLQRP